MRLTPIAAALALSACTHVIERPVPAGNASGGGTAPSTRYIQELEKFRAEITERREATQPRQDHTADALIRCSSLGFTRGSDGHQNCVLRALDRIDHAAQRYMRRDDEIAVTVPRTRIVEQYPAYPVQPPVAFVPQASYGGTGSSALLDCRVDRSGAPCYYPTEPQSPWGNPWQPGYNR